MQMKMIVHLKSASFVEERLMVCSRAFSLCNYANIKSKEKWYGCQISAFTGPARDPQTVPVRVPEVRVGARSGHDLPFGE